eukprot:15482463-Alexandrium_andersonii.AAC.1
MQIQGSEEEREARRLWPLPLNSEGYDFLRFRAEERAAWDCLLAVGPGGRGQRPCRLTGWHYSEWCALV